jgi:hypothetical protein
LFFKPCITEAKTSDYTVLFENLRIEKGKMYNNTDIASMKKGVCIKEIILYRYLSNFVAPWDF